MRTLALVLLATAALAGCDKKKSTPSNGATATTPTAPSAGSAPAATPTPPPSADGLKIGMELPKVGDVQTETEEQTSNITVLIQGKPLAITGVEHKVERKEAVAVDKDVVTKAKVTFTEHSKDETMGGKPHPAKAQIAGKSYLVWRDGKTLMASAADGGAVPPEEVAMVVGGMRSIGRPLTMSKIVSERAWKVGERVEFTAAQLEALNDPPTHADDEPMLELMAMTLTGSDATSATFAVEMNLRQTKGGGSMLVALKGQVALELATGRSLSLDTNGTVSGTLGGGEVSGSITVKTRYAYGG